MNSVIKDQALGLIRHILTFVGGIIVAKGLVSTSVETDIIGGVMTLIGAIWSIIDKTGNTPVPTPTPEPTSTPSPTPIVTSASSSKK